MVDGQCKNVIDSLEIREKREGKAEVMIEPKIVRRLTTCSLQGAFVVGAPFVLSTL